MSIFITALALAAGWFGSFHSAGPIATVPVRTRPAPRDLAYPGTIEVVVDARDVDHKLMHVNERLPLPAGGGPITLLYPQWESASHAPTLEANALAGLHLSADGKPVSWRRDPLDPFAYIVEPPVGARELRIEFDYISPVGSGPKEMTPNIVALSWSHVLLYPAGWYARNIPIAASVRLPTGFELATSLDRAPGSNDATRFAAVSLETLADSPVYAGRHLSSIPVGAVAGAPVTLRVLADDPAAIVLPPAQIERLRRLVRETATIFGRPPFAHYEALITLSEALPATGGTEHQRSSESNFEPDFFADPAHNVIFQDLIAHEFVHSWNGKSRQPEGLWTADLNTASDNSLLWVYEGMTEYWGIVLAARAGLRSPQETLDYLAVRAAEARARVGRSWKSLADSALDPWMDAHHSVSWRDWQGREAYYPEGVLLWLDIDTLLRERSGGRQGLDEVARRLLGGDGSETIRTYRVDDLVAALNSAVPMDWRSFLETRLQAHDDSHLYDGLARGGFALVDVAFPTEAARETEADEGGIDLRHGLGLLIGRGGQVRRVAWDSPAFRAGLAPGALLKTVNGTPYSDDELKRVLGRGDLELGFVQDGADRTAIVRGASAQTWPALKPTGSRPWLLDILRPHP